MGEEHERPPQDRHRNPLHERAERPMRGRYYFNMQYPDATVFGYEAPEKEIDALRPTLLSVISNYTILDPSGAKKAAPRPVPLAASPTFPWRNRGPRTAPSPCWSRRGGRWRGQGPGLLRSSRDGIAGVIFARSASGGLRRSQLRQLPHPGVIHSPYLHPVDALVVAMRATGSRNHKVLDRASDPRGPGRLPCS